MKIFSRHHCWIRDLVVKFETKHGGGELHSSDVNQCRFINTNVLVLINGEGRFATGDCGFSRISLDFQ